MEVQLKISGSSSLRRDFYRNSLICILFCLCLFLDIFNRTFMSLLLLWLSWIFSLFCFYNFHRRVGCFMSVLLVYFFCHFFFYYYFFFFCLFFFFYYFIFYFFFLVLNFQGWIKSFLVFLFFNGTKHGKCKMRIYTTKIYTPAPSFEKMFLLFAA